MPRKIAPKKPAAPTNEEVAAAYRSQHAPSQPERYARITSYRTRYDSTTAEYAPLLYDLVLATPFTSEESDRQAIRCLRGVAAFDVHANGAFSPARALSESHLAAYAKWIATERGVLSATAATYISHLRRVAMENGFAPHLRNRASHPRRSISAPTDARQWGRQLDALASISDAYRHDAQILTDLTYGAGARPDEAAKALGGDIRWWCEGAIITLVNKRGEPREVPVGPAVAARLRSAGRKPDEYLLRPGVSRHNLISELQLRVRNHEPSFSFRVWAARSRCLVNLLDQNVSIGAVAYLGDINKGTHALTDLFKYCKRHSPREIHEMLRATWR